MTEQLRVRRGDIWFCNLPKFSKDSRVQGRSRPVLICQPKEGENNQIITVAPISSSLKKNFPFLQKILLEDPSQIHYEQARPVDRKDLVEFICRLSYKEYVAIDIHMPISNGCHHSSFMHIDNIFVSRVDTHLDPMRDVYKCIVRRIFSEDVVYFTASQFKEHFGESALPLLKGDREQLAHFLKTLAGLKFIFMVESEALYNEP